MTSLARRLGLVTLTATGICSMVGASIHVVPFMIQRTVPGIGPYVLPAFLLAAVPASLAALIYAAMGTAMPDAGGSYVFASRGLHRTAGFAASFSQWFGLSTVIGVIAYIIPDFLRDLATAVNLPAVAGLMEDNIFRPIIALVILWTLIGVNLAGGNTYGRVLVPMMWAMFALGAIVIVAGLFFDQQDFIHNSGWKPTDTTAEFNTSTLLSAAAVLFASFIGFDAIAQAGGEAIEPQRNIPRATLLALFSVTAFYGLFTAAAYHMIPWSYIAAESAHRNLTAPGLLAFVLPNGWTVAILAGAAIALLNDLPGMVLSVSRLLYAWAADGIFPQSLAHVDPATGTPRRAVITVGVVSSLSIIGCHLAGDFFLGIDIMMMSMLVNFLLVAVALLTIGSRRPDLAGQMTLLRTEWSRRLVGASAIVVLLTFLVLHTWRDMNADTPWYLRGTVIWIVVAGAGILYATARKRK